jgi:hypothetical protein
MNLRLFVILLVLLALLFVVGLGLGFGGDDGGADFNAWQARMERAGSLIPRSTVAFEDIQRAIPGDCLKTDSETIVAAPGTSCTLTLPPARRARDWHWRLEEGLSAQLRLVQPVNRDGEPITTRETLVRGNEITLDVYRRQSEDDVIALTISCGFGEEACRLSSP